VPTVVYGGIAKYPLIAIPVFILAGMIFERSGVAAPWPAPAIRANSPRR
jgi:C4-dicarboxylate transporter, DctM subunit